MVRYFVLNENTLGYINDVQPTYLGALASSVIRGGHDPINGPVAIVPTVDRLRSATIKDFNTYRVSLPPDFKEVN